jgi:HD-like signal output (HDOD) protein
MGLFGFGDKSKPAAGAKPTKVEPAPAPEAEHSRKPATTLSAEHIRHFLPIRLLPRRVISYLAKQAKIIAYKPGDLVTHSTGDSLPEAVYLVKGTLEVQGMGATLHRISAKDAKATFPIAFDPSGEKKVHAVEPSILLYFPGELIKGAEKMSPDGKHYGVEKEYTGPEPGLFVELLDDAKAGRLDLPSPPDLGIRIGRAIDNPEASNEQVSRIIQLDPALTTRLIQVANSPLYSGLGKISNCNTAVTRLGLATTRNLVISFLLKNLFRNKSPVLQKFMDEVWKNSTKVAAISSVLAKVTPRMDPGRAMLAGLIHQIGAIAVINDAKRHSELINDAAALRSAVEHLSPEIGAIILEQWNFDQDLVDVVQNATNWMRDEESDPTYTDLVLIAKLHSYVGTPKMSLLPRLDLVPAFHKLALGRLTPELSIVVLDQSKKDIQAVEHLLL